MKVIDLLNKIANNEEIPKKIKWNNFVWQQDELEEKDYFKIREDGMLDILFGDYLHGSLILSLDDEVEIIEEKKIEELPYYSLKKIQKAKNQEEWIEERISLLEERADDYHNKINEIIEVLNGKD